MLFWSQVSIHNSLWDHVCIASLCAIWSIFFSCNLTLARPSLKPSCKARLLFRLSTSLGQASSGWIWLWWAVMVSKSQRLFLLQRWWQYFCHGQYMFLQLNPKNYACKKKKKKKCMIGGPVSCYIYTYSKRIYVNNSGEKTNDIVKKHRIKINWYFEKCTNK